NIVWGGGGANNNFSNGANWVGGTAPGTSDIAIFDPSQASGAPSPNKDATIDTSISVRGLFVEGTYTGTVTEPAASTVTLGSSGFFQSNGTFTVSGSGSITDSNVWHQIAGTFNAGTGTVTMNEPSGLGVFIEATSSFHNLTHSGSGRVSLISAVTVSHKLTNS